jgi:hypothetical protein
LVFIQCFYSFFYFFLCFLKLSIFVVLEFLGCVLYILLNYNQYHLYKILIDYLQDFFFQSILVGFIGFFGIVYLHLLECGSGHRFLHFSLVPVLIYYWGGKWFPSFFRLPIIDLAIITVPVLCVILYCLACNNNNGDF